MEIIKKHFTLEYWPVTDWVEGRFKEIPEVLAQGKNLQDLEQHLREDCADMVSDLEYARSHGYGHLDEADIWNAELNAVVLGRFQAAVAQFQALSPNRQEKVFAYIADLLDLEALERRADEEKARAEQEEGEQEEEW